VPQSRSFERFIEESMPYKDKEKSKEYHTRKAKEWYQDNPEKRAKIAHRYWQSQKGREVKRRCALKNVFWTPELWDKAYEEQKGVCAICGGVSNDKRGKGLASDHDHEKKIPRGLLCNACNLMLGKAKDNPDILLAAVEYLRKFGKNATEAGSGCAGTPLIHK
jgi:hypothetical protein